MKTNKGVISKSMGVDTKPAHKLQIGEHWVLIDPKFPKSMVNKLQELLNEFTNEHE